MNLFYKAIGISKQAVHQYDKRQLAFDGKVGQLVVEADELRLEHPGCGVKKMYRTLKPDFIGRDRFIDIFMQLGYRVKRKKNYRRTTYASANSYPNLIKGMSVTTPSVIWQSDITYIELGGRFYYAVFILDVFTRKIVGYKVSDHMRASANVQALKMALRHHTPPAIHHSDRGSQYTYKAYTALLNQNNCSISMGLSAQDNAYAERIHLTIKDEYLSYWEPKSYIQLRNQVRKAVNHYNLKRVHDELNNKTPRQVQDLYMNHGTDPKINLTIFNNES
jgi:transposase InsO family protein